MDNPVQRISLILGVACCGLLIGYFGRHFLHFALDPQYKIGLVYAPSRVFHAQAAHPIKELISHDKRFILEEFAVASTTDQMLLSSVCNKALESQVDLLMCIGHASAQGLINLSQRRSILKPIVFLGVSDPIELGIIDSIQRSGHNATGIFDEASQQMVNPTYLLRLAKPEVKKILLPYAVNERSNEPYALNIKALCKQRGVDVTLLPIDSVGDVMAKISGVLQGHDVLMYLEADSLATYGPAMAKLASQHGVTMFASSPDGILDSVLAYSIEPKHFALAAVELVKRILINKEEPAFIPAQLIGDCRDFIINTKFCVEQDLKNIDIPKIIHTINTAPEFEVVRGHVEIR